MKIRFRGLILFCMMLIIGAGCVETAKAGEDLPIFMFNREYYAVKDLTAEDIWKLKEINASDNIGAAKAAGIILGRHYIKKGDMEKGTKYLKDNLDDSYLDRYMKINGHLWMYDAAVKTNDIDTAAKEREYLLKLDMDDKAVKAFKYYCTQERIKYNEDDVKTCIQGSTKKDDIFALPDLKPQVQKTPVVSADTTPKTEQVKKTEPKTEPVKTVPDSTGTVDMSIPSTIPLPSASIVPDTTIVPNSTAKKADKAPIEDTESVKPDDTPSPAPTSGVKTSATGRKTAVVNIQNSVQNPEIIEAMLYTVSKLKINIDLDFEGAKPMYDYSLDAADKTVAQGATVVDFSVDRKQQMERAADLVLKSGANVIAIGYSEGLRDTASEIMDEYKGRAQFFLFNMLDKEFQARLKEIKAKSGGNAISYIVAGSQDQVMKVLPFLKYYSPRADKTVIAASLDSLSKRFYSGDYADYSRNAIVVTDILLAENPAAEKFASDFQKDFGKAPVLNDMLGYDMLVYMEKKRNNAMNIDYLTGISRIDANGNVIRKTGAYRIISGGKLQKIND